MTIKAAFPHGVLGFSKASGLPVFAMKLGTLRRQYDQLEAAGVMTEDIVKHLALVYEFLFKVVAPAADVEGRITTVIDFDGMGLLDMRGASLLQRRNSIGNKRL